MHARIPSKKEKHKKEMEVIKQTIENVLDARLEEHGLKRREPVEEAPDLTIPTDTRMLSPEFIRESFNKGTAHLKSRASYIWSLRNSKIEAWSLGEWSKHVKYSSIKTNGLQAATRYHEPHTKPRKRHRHE